MMQPIFEFCLAKLHFLCFTLCICASPESATIINLVLRITSFSRPTQMAPPSLGGIKYLKIFCCMCVLSMLICLFTINSTSIKPLFLSRSRHQGNTTDHDDIFSSYASCRLPKLDPFHPSILHLANVELPPLICENTEFPLLFNSTSDPWPKLIPVLGKRQQAVESCCFRKMIQRHTHVVNGAEIKMSKECRPLSLETETEIPQGWEFVAVVCEFREGGFWKFLPLNPVKSRKIVDVHAFFFDEPVKNGEEENSLKKAQKPVNVIVLALDATSRVNFLRTMPQVHFFLKNNLSALEMQGYHKIGENSLPNMGPLLSKKKFRTDSFHLDIDCAKGRFLDDCPLIWKNYKSAGYRTLLAEDAVQFEIFNYQRFDFVRPPTDHYFRTLTLAARKYTEHEVRSISAMCNGPRPAFNVMLDYLEQHAVSMERSGTPFFQFAWSDTVTHEFLNGGKLIASYLLEFLQRLDRRGVFNNTILIFMSDHGSRIGAMRNHFQGFLEDRLPVLYIAAPPSFQNRYPTAYANLVQNTKRLVTVWDIRQTLEDIADLESIDENKMRSRQIGSERSNETPGISLFLPVPATRTCETAGIPEEFCTCNMQVTTVSQNSPIAKAGAEYAVEHVNSKLLSFPSCALLTLKNVVTAEKINSVPGDQSTANQQQIMYRIVFETSPGDANFEAFLRINNNKNFKEEEGKFDPSEVTIGLGRLDVFQSQSFCIDRKSVKPFCYCIKNKD